MHALLWLTLLTWDAGPPPMAATLDRPRKHCNCSPECVCGCNAGHPCGCRVIEYPDLPGGAGGGHSPIVPQPWSGPPVLILPSTATPAPSGFFAVPGGGC